MKALKKSRHCFGRQIVLGIAVAGALSAARIRAQGVVYDNWSAVDDSTSGAGTIESLGIPDSFIGGAINLAPGTTDITGFDLFPVNGTNGTGTNISFSSIKLNVYVWGAVNTGAITTANPAFSDLLTPTPLSVTLNGALPPGFYFKVENHSYPHILPGLPLTMPLAVPGTTIGLTVEVQGSTDGVNYADYPGLTAYVAGGSVAPVVGSDTLEGWYRNVNGETNGNFTSSLRVSSDAYTDIGADIYGDAPGTVRSWTNASGGSFADSTQWNPAGVPGGNDTANFNLSSAAGYAVAIPSFVNCRNCAVLNDNVAFNLDTRLSQTYFSNTLTVGLSATAGTATTGSLALNNSTGVAAAIAEAGSFVIGGNGGTGTLTVTSGVYAYSDSDTAIGAGSLLAVELGAKLGTGTLTIAGSANHWTGQLDIGTSHLDIRNGSIGTVTNQVYTGYNKGAWNGMGIISSAAAADSTHLTAIGVILNNDGSGNQIYGNNSTGTLGLFDGENPPLNSVLLKYTYVGDANLDGIVDGSDYSLIDNGFLKHLSGWYNGDFNYDGVVNGSDYTLIDNAFNSQGSPFAPDALLGIHSQGITAADVTELDARLVSQSLRSSNYTETPVSALTGPGAASTTAQIATVPEPASLGLVSAAALSMLGRRTCKSCMVQFNRCCSR